MANRLMCDYKRLKIQNSALDINTNWWSADPAKEVYHLALKEAL